MTRTFHAWAILRADGHVVADTGFENEAHAWDLVLGWPGPEEIREAKRTGYKARYVAITYEETEAEQPLLPLLPPVP